MDSVIGDMTNSSSLEQTKQVIVIRKFYPDGKGGRRQIRSGKIASQAAHASMMWLSKRVFETTASPIQFSSEELNWLTGKFTKIVLSVDSEEELLALHQKALDKGLTSHIVVDCGLTEFGGESTHTAIAIGPHISSQIDNVTKGLSLL